MTLFLVWKFFFGTWPTCLHRCANATVYMKAVTQSVQMLQGFGRSFTV